MTDHENQGEHRIPEGWKRVASEGLAKARRELAEALERIRRGEAA